jgi:hypothetical protein
MNPLIRKQGGSARPGFGSQDEVEALQTDVMRFMAILGFCLMVVFALVKSMPMAPPDSRPRIDKPDSVAQVTLAKGVKAADPGRITTEPPRPAPVSREEAPKGFVLRFSSEKSLAALVERGDVGFYAMAGNHSWRLTLAGRHPVFEAAHRPGAFYQMAPQTVPDAYKSAFNRRVAAFGRERRIWGVTLPQRIRAAIRRQMERHPGGVLIIQEDGRVAYLPEEAGE